MAVRAAAATWRSTGGKRYKFLASLLRRLGHAPAGLRPQLAAAAAAALAGRANTHATLFSLARATIAFQLSARHGSPASGDVDGAEGSAAAARMHAEDAGAVLAGAYARFEWPVRIAAARKLLSSFVDIEEMAAGGTRCVAFVAQELAALNKCKAAGDAEVQDTLKGVLQAAMAMLTAASEVRRAPLAARPRHAACTSGLQVHAWGPASHIGRPSAVCHKASPLGAPTETWVDRALLAEARPTWCPTQLRVAV